MLSIVENAFVSNNIKEVTKSRIYVLNPMLTCYSFWIDKYCSGCNNETPRNRSKAYAYWTVAWFISTSGIVIEKELFKFRIIQMNYYYLNYQF